MAITSKSFDASTGKPKAVSGAIFRGSGSVALPTDASTALASGFVSLGYISEDGVTNTPSISTDEKKSWGGLIVLSSVTEKTDEFSFTMISPLNIDVLKTVYGETAVTVDSSTGNIKIAVDASDTPEAAFVIEVLVAGVAKRIVIPRGKVKEIGDIVYNDSDAIGYEVTVSALADANDKTHYEYIATSKAS